MRAFVTGLDGFAGQWLARELLAAGVDVGGGSRSAQPSYNILSPAEAANIAWSAFELSDVASIERALARSKPDAVFHLAATAFVGDSIRDPIGTLETNVLGTAHVLDAARRLAPDCTFLYVGSADAYGRVDAAELPLRETAPLRPINPYAASKAAAEAIALQYGRAGSPRVVATRSFNHIGPGQRPEFAVPSFAKQIAGIARGAEPVLRVGDLSARRDVSDVRDVARAYRLLVERGSPGRAYNVCSGSSVTMRAIVDELLRIAEVDATIETDPARLRSVDIPAMVGDNALIRADTGWAPEIELHDSLRDVYASFSQVPKNGRAN